MAAGFVSVPVVPTFRGMSKEFAERLEKPAKKSGEAAGKAISDGLGSSVENLERQVKASSSKLQDLDRAYEKSASKQAAQKEKVEAATLKLQDAEEKYQAALEKGDKGVAELAKVKEAKARVIGETEKLEQAEINTRVAEEKHKNQLDDLQGTLSRYDQAQDELADQLGVTRQELSKMGGEFSDLDAAMDDSSSKAESWGSRFSNMLKPLGKLGGIAVGLAGINSVAGTLQEGFDKVTSIEDTTASLGILMGSAEEATKVMGELEETNQKTPYSFDAWAGAGKNLIAFGVEADKTAGIVTALGEAASASGKGEEALNSMADAFGKAAASGKISMDTINSLSQGGVQGLTILANEFGVTTEEMQKMISSGQVSAEEGIDALTKGISEGSEGIAGDVASMSGVMQEMAETTSGRLTNMKAAFNNAAKSMLEEFNPLIGAAAEKITDWTYAGIDLFKTYMVPAIHDGVDAAKNVMETIKPALEVTRDVLKSVVGWLKDSAEWILKNKDWISSLAVSVGVLVGSYKLWMKYQKIMAAGGFVKWIMSGVKATKLWEAATKGAAVAQKVLNTVMKANPIGLVITAITALVAGLTWFFTKTETGKELWSKFMDVLKSGWDWISGVFADGWDWLADKIGGVIGRLSDVFSGLSDKVSYVKSTVMSAWIEMTSAFKGGDDGYVGLARIVGADKAEWIVGKLHEVGDALSKLPDLASGVWDILFKGDYTGLPFGLDEDSGVVDFLFRVRESVQDLWDFLQEKRDQLAALLQPVFEFMAGAMRDVVSSLGDIFKSLWDSLKSVGESLGSVLGSVAVSLFESLVSVIQSLWKAFQSLWEAVKPIGEFFAKLLLPILKVVGAVIGGVVVGAVFLLIEALKIVAEVLAWVADKFAWLMENVLGPLIEILGQVAAFIIDVVVSAFTWLAEKVTAVFTTVSEWIGTFLTFLQENVWPVVESILGFVGDAFTALWDGLSWAWENVIQPVFNGILELAKITIGVIATIILTPLLIAWNLLSTAIQWAWENVIQPVWQALSDFAMNTLWPVLQSVFQWIGDAWQWLSDKFSEVWGWIRDNVLNPMVDFFQNTLWPAIQSVIDWIVDKWNWLSETLSTVWGWIYDNVIQNVIDGFHAIWDAVSAVAGWIADKWNWLYGVLLNIWNWLDENVIQRQIRGFHRIWEAVLSVAGWIADKWQWMADRLHAGWVWVDENVLGPFKRGLDVLKGWFRSTVDNIGRIWDGIKEKTKAPVQFVVDVVYNGGIRKAWNAVAGLVGLDKLQEIKFATGGILPGYTPGRDPYTFVEPRTGMRIGLSGGEAILRPEATRALGKDWVDNINSAARQGGAAGVKDRLKHSHFATGGIIDLGNFAGGGFTNLAGPLSAVQKSQAAFVAKFFPGVFNLTSASRSEPGSYHDYSIQGATDWQNPATYATQMPSAESKALARAIFKNFHNSAELIHYPLDGWQNLKNGNPLDYGPGTNAGHTNHVHWATKTPIRFDGKELVLDDVPGEGGGWNPLSMVKRLWDKAMEKIGEFPGADKFGEWGKLPGAILKKLSTAAWEFVSGKASERGAVQGGVSAGVEQWRGMVEAVLKDKGYPVSLADTVLRRMNQESGGNPAAVNNWDSNAVAGTPSKGLMQVIDPTFQANKDPGYDDIFDPEANLRASMNYAVRQYGSLPAAYDRAGGYASGGIVDLPKLYDQGGWLPHGGFAQNLSGKPEPVLNDYQWTSVSGLVRTLGDLVPAIKGQTEVIAKAADDAQEWLVKAGDYNSIEGINARQGVRRLLDLGVDVPGMEVITSVLDAEDTLWDSRARAIGHVENLAEKEKALQEARKAAADLADKPAGVSEDDQKKIDEAQKKLDDAKADKAKADSDDARAKAADKVAEAEENLKEVREEVDKSTEENAQKHAEEVTKANEAVTQAEQELVEARKKQAMDLDNIVLLSQGQIKGLIPQAEQLATQLINMGAPMPAVNAGLQQVVGAISALAGFAGPAGITLGMAMDMLKVGIGIIKAIVGAIEDLIAKIRKARLDALKALADGWSVIADYAKLIVELQGNVTSLQQALIRGANAQREAEYNLMLAQHDRYIAEAEGALKVAEARLALDAEIKRGATIAQLKLMGLHEDWDSYMAYQAMQSQGVLEEWSDAAISALYTYEKARAEALKGEVSARLEQIKAEAALAEAARQNVRNQQDLLKAQERLIRMSAKVAGVDLVDATGTAQVAKLMAEMAEVKQAMDKNTLGRWGAALGAHGSYANEYRGQQAQYNSLQQALDAVLAETGVQIDRGNLDRVLKLMGRAAYRGGDPTAVLRAQLPELAQAETALKINESLKPVYDARDQRDDLARKVEDFTSEIDLYEKTTPLERTLKGLDYTIKSLEQSSQAWADGNEELRGEYLAAARANRDAAEAAGVDWKLDKRYANQGVRDQIRRETTIHLDGSEMYTADQIDQLLAEVTAGTSADYRIVRSASEVATARRKERV